MNHPGSALSQVTGAVATVKQTTKGDNNEHSNTNR